MLSTIFAFFFAESASIVSNFQHCVQTQWHGIAPSTHTEDEWEFRCQFPLCNVLLLTHTAFFYKKLDSFCVPLSESATYYPNLLLCTTPSFHCRIEDNDCNIYGEYLFFFHPLFHPSMVEYVRIAFVVVVVVVALAVAAVIAHSGCVRNEFSDFD